MLNPRVQSLPSSLFKWYPTGFHIATNPSQYQIVSFDMGLGTNTYAGTAPTQPPGAAAGDVYQVVFDTTNLTLTGGISASTMWVINVGTTGDAGAGTYVTFPLTNGMTLYAVCASASGNGSYALFPNYEAVFAGNSLRYAAASASVSIICPLVVCCVGSVNAVYTQANIG